MKKSTKLLTSCTMVLVAACGAKDGRGATDDAYTLYRSSPTDATLRIHVATFDSTEGLDVAAYNLENCEYAREAFAARVEFAAIGVKYFCEKGLFKR